MRMLRQERLKIEGMHCGGCVAAVDRALLRLGIEKRAVEVGSAEIEFDDSEVAISNVLDAIRKAGFTPHQDDLNKE